MASDQLLTLEDWVQRADDPDLLIEFGDCTTCHERLPEGECLKSLRPCGHHCNHSWDQDKCHWCGMEVGEDGEETWPTVDLEVSRG